MTTLDRVIELAELTKLYGRTRAVDGLTLNIPRGSIFGFLGPNGSGKTTTIRVLLGFLRPTKGHAAVLGYDSWRNAATIKPHVGYMPGDIRLPPWLTCRKGLSISAAAGNGGATVTRGRELGELFGLDEGVPVQDMSRGMRQKLGLILSLAHAPRLLVLDEPTASLDPIVQSRLYDVLRERAANGATVFLSSHTLGEVEQLCDKVAILRTGRLVAEDTVENLRKRASRIATVTWRSSVPGIPGASQPVAQQPLRGESLPAGCQVVERTPTRWRLALRGSAAEFVRWCAGQPLEDVSIGEPDLTQVFRSYYE